MTTTLKTTSTTTINRSTSKETVTTTGLTSSSVSTASTSLLNTTEPKISNVNLPQCANYMLITDETRRSTYEHYTKCDNVIFKSTPIWVRFSGNAGTRLAPGPMEPFHCGTQGTGWYKGAYPLIAGATTSGTVCYSWPGNNCMWSNQISITNCNDYYVFSLRAPPACFLRYCTV
jgi:hypothetical protein